jgi:alpha-mannosidase
MVLSGDIAGRPTALGIVNSGQHGFDLEAGEVRLSVLRSPLYCHERSFPLTAPGHKKAMDQGVHEFRVLLTAGDTAKVLRSVSGLADWLAAPPYALAHYPIGERTPARREILSVEPPGVRVAALKRSWDGAALILRLQETIGQTTEGIVRLAQPAATIPLAFGPFEIKTLRFERDGAWAEVSMIEEHVVPDTK